MKKIIFFNQPKVFNYYYIFTSMKKYFVQSSRFLSYLNLIKLILIYQFQHFYWFFVNYEGF